MQNGCNDVGNYSAVTARPQSIIVETILELSNINADLERRIGNISKDRAQAHRAVFELEAQVRTLTRELEERQKLLDDKNEYIEGLQSTTEKFEASYNGISNNFGLVVDQRDQLEKQNRKLSRELVKLMQYKKHYDKKGKN